MTGGASPGTYLISDDVLEDRNVYTLTEAGTIVAIFRFFEGSVRRRLEEDFEGEGCVVITTVFFLFGVGVSPAIIRRSDRSGRYPDTRIRRSKPLGATGELRS